MRGSPAASGFRAVRTAVPLENHLRRWRSRVLRARFPGTDKLLYGLGVWSPHDLTLPDFLCIGFMKAGTTWLYENLKAHPGAYLPGRKEIHYFDRPREFARPLASYAAHFRGGTGRLKGEVTPSYAVMTPGRIRFLRTIMPDVRLVMVLRNPVECEWSRVVHNLGDRLSSMSERQIEARLLDNAVRRAGGYARVVARWERIFPPDQLHLAVYRDIATRPRELLQEIFAHVGLSPEVPWDALPYRERIVPPHASIGASFGAPRDPHRGVVVREYTSSLQRTAEHYLRFRGLLARLYRDDVVALHGRLGCRVAHWLPSVGLQPYDP